jgi:putative DNA primase/helicase
MLPRLEHEHMTDLGNAERLVREHGRDLRFVPGIGWLVWDGRRWKLDADGEVLRRAKLTVRSMYETAAALSDEHDRKALARWATQSEAEARLRACVSLAASDIAVVMTPDQLNTAPWLLNAGNGTIDLTTGELREHRREDFLTKLTPVTYERDAHADTWDAFIATVTGGDLELEAFLQRAVGYSVTGDTGEEVIFFAHGPTATGKSSLLEAIKAAFGEYAKTADFDSFLARRGDAGVRNDVARLAGARLVVSVEVDEGKHLAEGLLKALTGGDTVTARFLYREAFEFRPQFKLWLAANARPHVNADDAAMWRRIVQVPFLEAIPEPDRDPDLKRVLRTTPIVQTAILAWAVRGALAWQRQGLNVPTRVRNYTAEYRAENDPLSDWLGDCCTLDAEAQTAAADLRRSYEEWAERNGEKPVAHKTWSNKLKVRGCASVRGTGGMRKWNGIRLRGSDA